VGQEDFHPFLLHGNRRMALLLVLELLSFNHLMVEEMSSICTTRLLFLTQYLFSEEERKWMGEGETGDCGQKIRWIDVLVLLKPCESHNRCDVGCISCIASSNDT
jgi:hypothetical protein